MTGRPVQRAEQARVAEAIGELERGLLRDDPAFVRRMGRLPRAEAVRSTAVAALLVASIVLMAAGLGARSAVAWVGGTVVFLAALAGGDRRR